MAQIVIPSQTTDTQVYVPPVTSLMSISGTINTMFVSGSTMYLGGNFNSIGGQARSGVAAINLNTNEVLPWNPNLQDVVGAGFISVSSICPSPNPGNIMLAGFFSGVSGQNIWGLAEVDTLTAAPTSWNANLSGSTFMQIYSVAADASNVYAAGSWETISGDSTILKIAKFNNDGTVFSQFVPSGIGNVSSFPITLTESDVIFSFQDATRVVKLSKSDASFVQTLCSASSAWTYASLLTPSGDLYLGTVNGAYYIANQGYTSNNTIKLNTSTGDGDFNFIPFIVSSNQFVAYDGGIIAYRDSIIYSGYGVGIFPNVNHIVAFNKSNGYIRNLSCLCDQPINASALIGDRLYVSSIGRIMGNVLVSGLAYIDLSQSDL